MRERTLVLKRPPRPPRHKLNLQPLVLPEPRTDPEIKAEPARLELIEESPMPAMRPKLKPQKSLADQVLGAICFVIVLGGIGLIALALFAPALGGC